MALALSINSTALPEPSSFSCNYGTVEKVMTTEDGYDKTILVRTGKGKFSLAWEGADSTFKATAEGYAALQSVTFDDGTNHTCRCRNLKADLVRYSNRYTGSDGLWNISFDLEEY